MESNMKCTITVEQIMDKIKETEEKRQKLIQLGKRIAEHLGVDELPIEFVDILEEDAKLVLKPNPKILIADHTYTKYEFLACCLAHEYRHCFQIYWANLMDDDIAKLWMEELKNPKHSGNIDTNNQEELLAYSTQAIEVDAEAFAIHYLRTFESINIKRKDEWYQRLLELYINKYKERL